MTEAEAQRLLEYAYQCEDTDIVLAIFDKLVAEGFGELLDGITYGFT